MGVGRGVGAVGPGLGVVGVPVAWAATGTRLTAVIAHAATTAPTRAAYLTVPPRALLVRFPCGLAREPESVVHHGIDRYVVRPEGQR